MIRRIFEDKNLVIFINNIPSVSPVDAPERRRNLMVGSRGLPRPLFVGRACYIVGSGGRRRAVRLLVAGGGKGAGDFLEDLADDGHCLLAGAFLAAGDGGGSLGFDGGGVFRMVVDDDRFFYRLHRCIADGRGVALCTSQGRYL